MLLNEADSNTLPTSSSTTNHVTASSTCTEATAEFPHTIIIIIIILRLDEGLSISRLLCYAQHLLLAPLKLLLPHLNALHPD